MEKRSKILSRICIFCMLLSMLLSFSACGNDTSNNSDNKTVVEEIKNGEVESPEAFKKLGLYIDIQSSKVTDVKYRIEDGEIAVVSFIYNGLDCEFRGSCTYKRYDLAKVKDTSTGDILSTNVGGYGATYYTLVPGRLVFWNDENVNYSFYTYVTASDEVVKEIVDCLIFENHYEEREDVAQQTANDSEDYARQIVMVFQNKKRDVLAEMVYYPQQLGGGQSAANEDELMEIPEDELFTEILLTALSEDAIDDLRMSEDGTEYIIGTNYKNVHFKKMEDGTYKIVKINN